MASYRHLKPAMVSKPQFTLMSKNDDFDGQVFQRNRLHSVFKSIACGSAATGLAFGFGIGASNVANAEIQHPLVEQRSQIPYGAIYKEVLKEGMKQNMNENKI